MIYLKKLPFVDTFESMREVVELDNLANLKKHLSALHCWVPSRYRKDEELVMQTLHLVISYEDGDKWRLYMPDCIRRELYRAQRAEFINLLGRMSGL